MLDSALLDYLDGLHVALDPSARFEQLCDIEAMSRIGRERSGFKPDRALAYALAEPALQGDVMSAKGAAFRSGGK